MVFQEGSIKTLFIGPADIFKLIKKLFATAEGVLESDNLEHCVDYDDALEMAKNGTLALVFIEELDAASSKLVSSLRKANKCPIVVMTDDKEALKSLREIDQTAFLPVKDLNARVLGDVLSSAEANFNLTKTYTALEKARRNAEQRFQDVADHFADWLWEIDGNLNVVLSSSRKRSHGEVEGKRFAECFLPDEIARVDDDFRNLLENPKGFQDREYWSFDSFGNRQCWSLSGVPIIGENGQATGFRGVGRDVSRQKSSTDQLYYLANHDQLTGLYNRSRFWDELGRIARQSVRDNRHGMVVQLVVDRFRYINETYGHEVGDKLLVHVAQTLKDCTRSGDFVARTGPDEFTIVMPDVSAQDVEFRTSTVFDAIKRRPLMAEGGTVTFGVSMGCVRFPEYGNTPDELMSRVAIALSMAKQKGRNRVDYYDEKELSTKHVASRLEWRDFVVKCLDEEQDRLLLYYQPIVKLTDIKRRDFYEVLVRLLGPDDEPVAPVKFIEIAEEFGLVSKLDQVVALRAINNLQNWHARGLKVRLSINMSSKTFDDNTVIDRIEKALNEAALPPGTVIIEITETAALRDISQVKAVMKRLKAAGAGFAMDDCGSGYSSLSYIRQLDLDIIKIDGEFVREMHKNNSDSAFVQALRDMAKKIDIYSVAEMVETKEAADQLIAMGVDYAQGYYYAMPMPNIIEDLV